ncbi:hypothetical protein [Paractinoplanes rishiriensis]|nr:hypothetical protein [Actinoplanes rishiriensis]
MRSPGVDGDPRLLSWLRVREFAVPPSMIETATTRRAAGDWSGACAAAHLDADVDVRAVAQSHGRDLATRLRTDLRHLAPDLLRWHWPRAALPDGLLRPGVTVALATYPHAAGALHLVARTPPAWADAGQRISLTLWPATHPSTTPHPHPHPDRRFRLDLHRHLWDARRAPDLRHRTGAEAALPTGAGADSAGADSAGADSTPAVGRPPAGSAVAKRFGAVRLPDGGAVHRWVAEAAILREADGRPHDPVVVRVGARFRLALDPGADGPRLLGRAARGYPVLPHAATWLLPDLELLRAGLITLDQLHPLVAAALAPAWPPARNPAPPPAPVPPPAPAAPRLVECRGEWHRIAVVAGVLTALDHDPAEVWREELFAALGGLPLACLRAIDLANREPASLDDIRARLDHGDTVGALAVVEELLGAAAALRGGALRDELETAAARRVTYGLYRAGLAGRGPLKDKPPRRRAGRSRTR